MHILLAWEDHVGEIVALVQFVLTRLTDYTFLLVEELEHTVRVSSRCTGLVIVQGIEWKIDRSNFILKHAEVLKTLMGTSEIRTVVIARYPLFLFFN